VPEEPGTVMAGEAAKPAVAVELPGEVVTTTTACRWRRSTGRDPPARAARKPSGLELMVERVREAEARAG
jgi:hypothetical protein